ncbi:unnamed protein product [Coregonus sp. 'balchen']|nr:unnamed protein product [Coregonus sp. 'balchen']
MMVTVLELVLCYQGKKLRGFTCKLTRSAHGFLPESSWQIAAQVLLPYLVAGLGMVSAGVIVDIVQANTGQLDDPKHQWKMVCSNLALIQVQASVVGFLAAVSAIALGSMSRGVVELDQAAVVSASITITAFMAALSLGLVMIRVIIGINPDNVAKPIAASLGDLITLSLLAGVSTTLYHYCGVNSKSAMVLFLLVVPGGHTDLTVTFIICYLCAALLQVGILLCVADLIVHWMWRRSLDPDNFSVPYLKALGDLLGTRFQALVFRSVSLMEGLGL